MVSAPFAGYYSTKKKLCKIMQKFFLRKTGVRTNTTKTWKNDLETYKFS